MSVQENREFYNFIVQHTAPYENNVVNRHLQETCFELFDFEKTAEKPERHTIKIPAPRTCYGCAKPINSVHSDYVYSCYDCGELFRRYRHFSTRLDDRIALVTGARTKLGHQIALKLARAGARVIVTSRRPQDFDVVFKGYSDYESFKDLIIYYPDSLDFDSESAEDGIKCLAQFIEKEYGRLDILVNCAAQTIRARDKQMDASIDALGKNRYNDSKFVSNETKNSWAMTIFDVTPAEMLEVYRVNAMAPMLIIRNLVELMKKSLTTPHIVNVHAREGLFEVEKSVHHVHLNMAKAAECMLTKCLISYKLTTEDEKLFSIHGVDPGWFSVDEYYQYSAPWVAPPLDEIDGAARIVFPIFKNCASSRKTRRHFHTFTY